MERSRCYGLNCAPPAIKKNMLKSQPPVPHDTTLFVNSVVADVIS